MVTGLKKSKTAKLLEDGLWIVQSNKTKLPPKTIKVYLRESDLKVIKVEEFNRGLKEYNFD